MDKKDLKLGLSAIKLGLFLLILFCIAAIVKRIAQGGLSTWDYFSPSFYIDSALLMFEWPMTWVIAIATIIVWIVYKYYEAKAE